MPGETPEQAIERTNRETAAADAKQAADAKAVKDGTSPKPVEETTPKPEETTPKPEETTPKAEETTPKPVLVPKDEVERRIGRMYARLQTEKDKRITAENRVDLHKKPEVDENGDPVVKPLTAAQAEAIWDRKENERRFKESETKVLIRHTTALNEDGSFNMNDTFTRAYIDVGRKNPSLAFMINGPELAEAMVEKEMGTQYKAGAVAAATNRVAANNAHTGTSTTTVPATTITKLSDFKRKIAARMNMTEQQYMDYEVKIAKGDKKV